MSKVAMSCLKPKLLYQGILSNVSYDGSIEAAYLKSLHYIVYFFILSQPIEMILTM